MNLSDFSSVLEIFTAFNFAFVLSDGFFKAIQQSFSHAKNELSEQLNDINTRFKHCEEQLEGVIGLQLESSNGKKSNASKIASHQDEINTFRKRFEPLQDEIKNLIETNETQKEFYPICLFSAFYCIIILLLSPLENNIKPLLFSLTSMYLLWFTCARLTTLKKANFLSRFKFIFFSHHYSIYGILGIVFVSIIFQLIYFTQNLKFLNKTFTNFWELVLYIIVILPSFHFIYFYIKVLNNKNKHCSKPLTRIQKFSKEFHEKCFDPITRFVSVTEEFVRSLEEDTTNADAQHQSNE